MYNFNEVQTQRNIRTKFVDTHNHKTTGNAGDLIPIFAKEILPGDEIKLDVKSLTKMTTPNFQTMDCAFQDIQFYFVPRRLVWKHWKNFQGERNVGPHDTQPEYTVPVTSAPASNVVDGVETGGWHTGTIADYLGIPTYIPGLKVDSAYFRAYCLIWNEWFRDQNRQDFTDFDDSDSNTTGSNGTNYVTDAIKGGAPLKVAKIHDYFTSSLLTPTGSQRVELPLGTSAPVYGSGSRFSVAFKNTGDAGVYRVIAGISGQVGAQSGSVYSIPKYQKYDTGADYAVTGNPAWYYPTKAQLASVNESNSPMYADLENATAATVNQLRLAFQLQKIFEANNRSGSRYAEQLRNRWNVIPSDASLQRPEYLGGKRIPLNIQMVVQTSSTDLTSPLGQIAGYSNTFDENIYFHQKFEEHGILMGLTCVRHQRTYQQGLSRMFSRKNMEDFYMPEFQNIGEQAILNKEIFAQGPSVVDSNGDAYDDQVFGYQEYGAEYRFTPNRVSGQFRSNAANSFDNWHYADDYSSLPVNGADWIVENPDAIDRTLTLASTSGINQFYFDFQFVETEVRTMPPHSIPGFIDHH